MSSRQRTSPRPSAGYSSRTATPTAWRSHAVFGTLSKARFSVFLDAFVLAPASDFAERIEHELLDKAFLILIETPEAVASSGVLRELAFAPVTNFFLLSADNDPRSRRLQVAALRRDADLRRHVSFKPAGWAALHAPKTDPDFRLVYPELARGILERQDELVQRVLDSDVSGF